MKRTKVYLHSSKESMLNEGERLGLNPNALEMFKYACYEVELELEVDEQTGQAVIVKCDGMELKKKELFA